MSSPQWISVNGEVIFWKLKNSISDIQSQVPSKNWVPLVPFFRLLFRPLALSEDDSIITLPVWNQTKSFTSAFLFESVRLRPKDSNSSQNYENALGFWREQEPMARARIISPWDITSCENIFELDTCQKTDLFKKRTCTNMYPHVLTGKLCTSIISKHIFVTLLKAWEKDITKPQSSCWPAMQTGSVKAWSQTMEVYKKLGSVCTTTF